MKHRVQICAGLCLASAVGLLGCQPADETVTTASADTSVESVESGNTGEAQDDASALTFVSLKVPNMH